MATKKDLSSYITNGNGVTHKAEVKFTPAGSGSGPVHTHTEKKISAVEQPKKLSSQLTKVSEYHTRSTVDTEIDRDVAEIESEVDEQMLDEGTEVNFVKASGNGTQSPMTYVPNAQHESPSTEQISETAMLIKLIGVLIDKVDAMQNFNPVIHVPAPVIHVTMPETRRTVTKAVERDENNWIKSVTEQIEETPLGDPLIEVAPQPNKYKKKDNK